MKKIDKYSKATVEVCQKALDITHNVDKNITIGELKAFLENRITDALKEAELTKIDLVNKLEGKCFRIEFHQHHVVLLKIDKVVVFEQNGVIDADIHGEKIISYNNDISYCILYGGNQQLYSGFKHQEYKEYTNEKFDIIARRINSVSF